MSATHVTDSTSMTAPAPYLALELEIREIRCQFVFSGKNDELTPDVTRRISRKNDELTLTFPLPEFPTSHRPQAFPILPPRGASWRLKHARRKLPPTFPGSQKVAGPFRVLY